MSVKRSTLAAAFLMAAADMLEPFRLTSAELSARGADVNRPIAGMKQRHNAAKNARRKVKRELGHRPLRRAEKNIRSFKG